MSEHDLPALLALYRARAHEQPSAAMDRRILEAARRPRRRPRWKPALALAASLLLGLLVLRLQQHDAAAIERRDRLTALTAGIGATTASDELMQMDLRPLARGPGIALEASTAGF